MPIPSPIWGNQGNPLRFDAGQEPDDPPLKSVIVQGNVVYHPGQDELEKGAQAPPFRYTVRIPAGLKDIHFSSNVSPAGRDGVSNHPLPP